MSRAVWKFPLNIGRTLLDMPMAAEPVYVAAQSTSLAMTGSSVHAQPSLWAVVLTDAATERRAFEVIGTGHPVPDGSAYIGSFMLDDGAFVGHVFEVAS